MKPELLHEPVHLCSVLSGPSHQEPFSVHRNVMTHLELVALEEVPSFEEINSNDFGRFGNVSTDSNSNFVVADFFLNDSIFWCVQSSIT